ncbi:hypothetical protein BH11ACT3_BH11ACT3_04670 [soil metagenome]
MDAVARTWLGFAALGAGLVHFALAVGSPPAVAVGFVIVGAAEFAWGVFAFTTDHLPLPWLARAGALFPVVLWALALVTGLGFADFVRVFPMLAASALDLAIAIGVTFVMRTTKVDAAASPPRSPRTLRPPAYLAAMFAGALVVGAVTTPALAATEAGEFASHSGHGTTGLVDLPADGHDH